MPIVSVEYGRECIALAAYCVRLKHVFLPQGLLNTHRRPWQYSMCMYTLTDSHTNSQLVYENGRWVRTQAKEHTHLLNVSGGAGILGRGERSCQVFWLNPRGNCNFLLQRTRSWINTHTKLSICNCIVPSFLTFDLVQTIDSILSCRAARVQCRHGVSSIFQN